GAEVWLMKARQPHVRAARVSHDYLLMLAMMFVVCIAIVRILTPDQATDSRPLWERLLASLVGLLQCFGLLLGACVLLALIEAISGPASRSPLRRIERRRERLEPLIQDASDHANAAELGRVARSLDDGNDAVRRHAVGAAFALLRRDPSLADPSHHAPLS